MKIIHASGQMCNQFWIISNYLADCIEYNKKISIWLPDFSLEKFDKIYTSKYFSFPLYPKFLVNLFGYKRYSKIINSIFNNKIMLRISYILLNLFPNIEFIISDVTCKKSKYKHKHLKTILNIISPNSKYIEEVGSQFGNLNKEEILIGIHIRYGDYRTFQNGKYFYTLEEYNQLMIKIRSVFSDKIVKFFIASNETIDYSVFKKHYVVKVNNPSSLKDLIGLSRCDYICGPPSTFSAWASLYNNAPIYFIENLESDFNKNSFADIQNIWF